MRRFFCGIYCIAAGSGVSDKAGEGQSSGTDSIILVPLPIKLDALWNLLTVSMACPKDPLKQCSSLGTCGTYVIRII